MSQVYHVKLEQFEGPLDLLLHLVNRYEIDLYDIPVAMITDQYMEYIQTMKILELNLASEYLVMAATLIQLKSKMLLPQPISPDVDEYEEDPREELRQRLIEYQKYKQIAANLKENELADRTVYPRGNFSFEQTIDEKPEINQVFHITDMIDALKLMLRRKKWQEPLDTKITKNEISINQRMKEIRQKISLNRDGVLFDQLFTYESKSHIVITFLAILELMKTQIVLIKQKAAFSDLYIYYNKEFFHSSEEF